MSKPHPKDCSACKALANVGQKHRCAGDRCYWEIVATTDRTAKP